jgi:hypothetical protein
LTAVQSIIARTMLITSYCRRGRELIILRTVGKVRGAQLQKRRDRADLLIGCSLSCLQVAQDSTDQYLAIDNSDLGSTDDIQNLTTELIPPARQSDESASDEALDIVATLCDSKIDIDSRSIAVRNGSDTTSQQQACISNVFQSPQPTATIATPSLSESGDGLERPEQIAEVVDADQE